MIEAVKIVVEVKDKNGKLKRHPITLHEDIARHFLAGENIFGELGGYDGEFITNARFIGA